MTAIMQFDKSKVGRYLGSGMFSKAYLYNKTHVYLKSTDPIKECMAHGWFPESKLFPKVYFAGNFNEDGYIMKRYPFYTSERLFRSKLNSRALEQYESLRDVCIVTARGDPTIALDLFKNFRDKRLRNIMVEAYEACMDYDNMICFEANVENLSHTKSGNLILRDCFFSKKAQMECVRSAYNL